MAATMLLMAILLPVLFGLAAFAINIAYMEAVNTDVQITVDAAARASGRAYMTSGEKSDALIAAQEAATLNPVAGGVIPITAGDLEYGVSTRNDVNQPYTFVPGTTGNAVRVTTNSLASGTGSAIPALFPFFGSAFEIRPARTATSTQATLDIALVLDRSGSMAFAANEASSPDYMPAAAPAGWNYGDAVPPQARWLDLVGAVGVFTTHLNNSPQDEWLSLSTYSLSPTTNVTLTDNYGELDSALNAVSMNFTGGGTGIGNGIYEGIAAVTDPSLSRDFATKVIVLMTDGIHNYGSDPVWAAITAKNKRIMIFTITFSDEAYQPLMATVASKGGGKHYHAVDAAQLQDAFREIAKNLPTLLTD